MERFGVGLFAAVGFSPDPPENSRDVISSSRGNVPRFARESEDLLGPRNFLVRIRFLSMSSTGFICLAFHFTSRHKPAARPQQPARGFEEERGDRRVNSNFCAGESSVHREARAVESAQECEIALSGIKTNHSRAPGVICPVFTVTP